MRPDSDRGLPMVRPSRWFPFVRVGFRLAGERSEVSRYWGTRIAGSYRRRRCAVPPGAMEESMAVDFKDQWQGGAL